MTNPTPSETSQSKATPVRCLIGSIISGGLAFLMYRLTMAIALTYANKPIASHSAFAIKIASAVRTLVTGVTALAAALFAVATLGLIALGIQLLIQSLSNPQDSTNS